MFDRKIWPVKGFAAVILASVVTIAGCGGSGGGNDPATGTLDLSITDSPTDFATEVRVEFSGIAVKPRSGEAIQFYFDPPVSVDLLSLTGENTASLLNDQQLDAGEYNWIRLDVNADSDSILDSYVMTRSSQMIELEVTSQTGLKLVSGFTVTANQVSSFVIDWDLRKGLNIPNTPGGDLWRLRPALRITDLNTYGEISGTVSETLMMADDCTSNLAEDTGSGVYVFSGSDLIADDIQGLESDPVTIANVKQDINGIYRYTANFLSPGDYTVAFTCQVLGDMADANDDVAFPESQNASVADREEAFVDFGS